MRVLIVGAGGHAQVVADILRQSGQTTPVGFLDDDPALCGSCILDLPVLGAIGRAADFAHEALVMGIGNNHIRQKLFEGLCQKGERFIAAVHPKAIIAAGVALGCGTVVCAGVIVSTGAAIGDNVILNTGCTVDHHSHIGAHSHVAPGVHCGGDVRVEPGAFLGIGSTVVPGRRIGAWATVGAGACVIDDVPCGVTVVGVPARPIKCANHH